MIAAGRVSQPSVVHQDIDTDLVVEEDVPKVFCKAGYGSHVHSLVVVLVILVTAGLFGQKLQLVPYPL